MDVELIRQTCLSLSGVSESVKWGNNLVFSVGTKMFCLLDLEPPFRCSFKVADEDFETLCERKEFSPAPYLSRAGWVMVSGVALLGKKEWHERLRQSYELVRDRLSKKDREALGLSS